MSLDLGLTRFDLCGVPITATDMNGFVDAVRRWQELRDPADGGAFVCFRDAHGIVRSWDDERIQAAHHAALMNVPDGKPLAVIGRLRGHRQVDQVSGIEATELICRVGVPLGWKHYFFGGGPGVADELRSALEKKIPGLQVVGTETPPFRELTLDERREVWRRITASGAHFVWVGLSSPKQELWMAANAPMLPGVMAMGVGAAFDVHAGRVARAPKAFRKLGLEWLYRMLREPTRLWRRYAEVVPRFLWLVGHEQIQLRRSKGL